MRELILWDKVSANILSCLLMYQMPIGCVVNMTKSSWNVGTLVWMLSIVLIGNKIINVWEIMAEVYYTIKSGVNDGIKNIW